MEFDTVRAIVAEAGYEFSVPNEEDVNAWWLSITGYRPADTPPFIIGIPVYNEAETLPDLFDCLMAQILPSDVHKRIVIVTNASTDSSPDIVKRILERHSGGVLLEGVFCWKEESLHLLSLDMSDERGHLIVTHIHTEERGKNNALNIIRAYAADQGIHFVCSLDGDSYYPPSSTGELLGALINPKNNYPVAAGVPIFVYNKDIHPILYKLRGIFLSIRQPQLESILWGGLFAYDSERIPPFPGDIMYEDLWLKEYTKKVFGGRTLAYRSYGFQLLPSQVDRLRNYARHFVARYQLRELYPNIISDRFVSVLHMSLIDGLKTRIEHKGNPLLRLPLNIRRAFVFLLTRYLAQRQLNRLIQGDPDKLKQIVTFETEQSTKRRIQR